MTCTISTCLGFVAPFYNLVLVTIVIGLFIALFKLPKNNKIYVKPWKLLLFAVSVYVLEEALTVTDNMGLTDFPRIANPIFEMIIITTFIYLLLLQHDWVKK